MQKKWYDMREKEFSRFCLKCRIIFQIVLVQTIVANICSALLQILIDDFLLWLLFSIGIQAVFAIAYTVELKIVLPIIRSDENIRQHLRDSAFNRKL